MPFTNKYDKIGCKFIFINFAFTYRIDCIAGGICLSHKNIFAQWNALHAGDNLGHTHQNVNCVNGSLNMQTVNFIIWYKWLWNTLKPTDLHESFTAVLEYKIYYTRSYSTVTINF